MFLINTDISITHPKVHILALIIEIDYAEKR